MKKIKRWVIDRFLPELAKELLLEENQNLKLKLEHANQKNDDLLNYLDGMERALKLSKPNITIYGGEHSGCNRERTI